MAEARILGALCTRAGTIEQLNELASSLDNYAFLEPEHQIVFQSIRSLLSHDRLSITRLAVHLNNRGFPDVPLEKYCAATPVNINEGLKLARELCSLAAERAAGVSYDDQKKAKHEL